MPSYQKRKCHKVEMNRGPMGPENGGRGVDCGSGEGDRAGEKVGQL